MNIKELGGALDHFKGSFLRRLDPAFSYLRVVPMFTGRVPWSSAAFDLYADLLGMSIGQILMRNHLFSGRRRKLYMEVLLEQLEQKNPPDCDLFLDPDLGISDKRDYGYITPQDIDRILRASDKRLIIIFQRPWRQWQEWLDNLSGWCRRYQWHAVVYCAGEGSMLFLCKDEERISELRNRIEEKSYPLATGIPCMEKDDAPPSEDDADEGKESLPRTRIYLA